MQERVLIGRATDADINRQNGMTLLNHEQYRVQSADRPADEPIGVDDFFEMSHDNVCVAGLNAASGLTLRGEISLTCAANSR